MKNRLNHSTGALMASLSMAATLMLAAFPAASQSGDAAASHNATTLYCWKDKLQVTGTALVCNWAESADEACKGNPITDVARDAVSTEPVNAKRCNNGQWLVQVTRK